MTRKVLRGVLFVLAVAFAPVIDVVLYAQLYLGGFLLRKPRIYHYAMRRHNARVDRKRLASAERARRRRT